VIAKRKSGPATEGLKEAWSKRTNRGPLTGSFKCKQERSAESGFRLNSNASALSLHGFCTDGKSHPGAWKFKSMQSLGRRKDGLVILLGHADAVVRNRNQPITS
jgi:hypothetical protein